MVQVQLERVLVLKSKCVQSVFRSDCSIYAVLHKNMPAYLLIPLTLHPMDIREQCRICRAHCL